MLGLQGGIAGIDVGSASLASDHGPVEPPMSWLQVPGTDPALSLLIARAQPGLAAGTTLTVTDELGGIARLELHAIGDVRDLLASHRRPSSCGSPASSPPGRSACFAGRKMRPWPASAATLPRSVNPPTASPPRRCPLWGRYAGLVAAPRPASAPATSLVIGRHRLRHASHAAGAMVLGDRRFEDGYLLPAAGEGPIHLAPPGRSLPTLASCPPPGCAEQRALSQRGRRTGPPRRRRRGRAPAAARP